MRSGAEGFHLYPQFLLVNYREVDDLGGEEERNEPVHV